MTGCREFSGNDQTHVIQDNYRMLGQCRTVSKSAFSEITSSERALNRDRHRVLQALQFNSFIANERLQDLFLLPRGAFTRYWPAGARTVENINCQSTASTVDLDVFLSDRYDMNFERRLSI